MKELKPDKTQENKILELFYNKYILLTASKIEDRYNGKILITSVRRALSMLEAKGKIVLHERVAGPWGRLENNYKLPK